MSLASPLREVARQDANKEIPTDPYQRLRQLLLGPEQTAIEGLQQRLDNPELRAEELSRIIAEAIALRSRRDHALQNALNPLLEEALRISVARNSRLLADTLFPIIGRAVRNSVAHALRAIVESLNETLERSVSWDALKWRLESLRTGKPFGEIVLARSLRYRVEQVFVIHREAGLLLAHVSRERESTQENETISGMLTAVEDFVHDSFAETSGAELDTVELGEFNVWIQHGPQTLLCAVVTGTPPRELRNVLQRTLEELHSKFAPVLTRYDGDTESTSAMRPLLQACLVGQQPLQGKRTASRAWLWVALPVTALLLALCVNWLVQRHRWNLAVANLRAEPGIALTSEEKVWRGYRLTGLRDPMAADPTEIMRRVGVDPAKVNARWEQYFSLDPKFDIPRHIAEERVHIERQVILFRVNSSQLDAEQLLRLDDIESSLRRLQGYASASGRELKVEIAGHTDPTGPEVKNVTLSQKRADEVMKALTDRGISADAFTRLAKASQVPFEWKAGSYIPELSRRVTFRVLMDNEPQ
jgi:outer membrane protein OmpA-like peptidoglycan-associated protein